MFSSFYYGITVRNKMLQELMSRVLVPFYGNKIPDGQKGHNKGSVFDRLFNMSDQTENINFIFFYQNHIENWLQTRFNKVNGCLNYSVKLQLKSFFFRVKRLFSQYENDLEKQVRRSYKRSD